MTAVAISASQLEEVVAGVIAFLEQEVRQRHDRHSELLRDPRRRFDQQGCYTPEVLVLLRDIRMAAAAADYYAMFVPSQLGGGGLGMTAQGAVWEALFRWSGPELWLASHAISHWATGPSHILTRFTPELQAGVVPPLMAGQTSMCFAMSEPDAGSDPWMMTTTARPTNDGWSISGVKQWITNAPYADHALVFAVTDPDQVKHRTGGISAFLVPTSAAGYSLLSVIRMFGELGGEEGVISLDDVEVGPHQLVGDLHRGLQIGLSGVAIGRLHNAARAVGLGRWALAKAVHHTRHRQTFGRPLTEYQGVTFPLAESAMELHAASLLTQHAAALLDQGLRASAEVAMAKAYATEAAVRAIDRSIQAHGASGLVNELHLTEAWQQVRKTCIADGSAEILRRQMAKALMQGDFAL